MTYPINYIRLESIASTNSYLISLASHNLPHATVAITDCQTAGRGQRGNSWEAEPGKNITLSLLLRPHNILPASQFVISEAVSLGIVNTLRHYLTDNADISIKWPNDIYVGNNKICGILIENSIMGAKIVSSIAGIGLNVNQEIFLSNAPNPISMTIISGEKYSVNEVVEFMVNEILRIIDRYDGGKDYNELHEIYKANLWRKDGFHPFIADGKQFQAKITDIAPDGILTLTDENGSARNFAFKEVAFIL